VKILMQDVRAPDHYRVIGKTGIFVIY
jgi:hypothetical protein